MIQCSITIDLTTDSHLLTKLNTLKFNEPYFSVNPTFKPIWINPFLITLVTRHTLTVETFFLAI